MGIAWEIYHKGVPLLGVPENPIDNVCHAIFNCYLLNGGILIFFGHGNPY